MEQQEQQAGLLDVRDLKVYFAARAWFGPRRVVLMGVAQSQQEAALAAAKVRGVKGVKALVSHLRVVAPLSPKK